MKKIQEFIAETKIDAIEKESGISDDLFPADDPKLASEFYELIHPDYDPEWKGKLK